jgi:ribosomal protein S18 acetylase RimI-like enzyme
MIKSIDLMDDRLVWELYELQRTAYMVEAELINFYDIPPLKETMDELTECDETFLGYFEENELVGALSYTVDGHEVTICRMIVHPGHFRKGIAQKLLFAVEKRNGHFSIFKVSTGRENLPARALYQKNGFHHLEDIEIMPGFFISSFIKKKPKLTNESSPKMKNER